MVRLLFEMVVPTSAPFEQGISEVRLGGASNLAGVRGGRLSLRAAICTFVRQLGLHSHEQRHRVGTNLQVIACRKEMPDGRKHCWLR